MIILFLHGWQSIPGGVKPTYLAQHGYTVINPKLPDDDFERAVRVAQAEFDQHQPDVIVGSSRGGAVAMNIDSGETPLVLLCPAWKRWGTATKIKGNATILHSRADDVIPFEDSEQLLRNSGLPPYLLVETGSDHRLADPESLELMLEACQIGEVGPTEEATNILHQDWSGHCYQAALEWMREADEEDWILVHGTVMSERVGKRIDHAWCERGDFVIDLAMPLDARLVNREQYYRVLEPEVSNRYTKLEALLLSVRNCHAGPWDE